MDAYLIEVNNRVDKTEEINVWLPEDIMVYYIIKN